MRLSNQHQQEIKSHNIFRSLSNDNFQTLMCQSGLLTFKKNKIIFECNSKARHFYLVRTGEIILFQYSPSGKEKILGIYGPGETFAESILFTEDYIYPVNARTVIDSEVYFFDIETFKNQLKQSTELCFLFMAELSQRINQQSQDITDLSIHDAQHRLINFLIQTCCKGGKEPCQSVVKLPTTKLLLASFLSVTPETLSRIFKTLKNQGLIGIEEEIIYLKDPQKLRRLIDCDN